MEMQAELSPLNQRELSKLIISIRANAHHLDLFLAVCDDRELRDLLIRQYETTLANDGFTPYRVGLNPKAPSLKATLDEFVKYNPASKSDTKVVVTVLGSSSLFGVRLTEDKSEQEKFFFSLQWTREALREFKFPVVIWLSNTVATGLSQQAPDFWSWRSGVFEFESPTSRVVQFSPFQSKNYAFSKQDPSVLRTSTHTIADLKQQITELLHQNQQSPLLITLYSYLGDAYSQQAAHESALYAYEKALQQAENHNHQPQQAEILLKLGTSLLYFRRYEQARTYYHQSLNIFSKINNRSGQARNYHMLGMVAEELRDYEQAQTYYQQALDIFIETNNRDSQASTYHQLGIVAEKLKDYEQAQAYYQQALDISIETNNRNGQAITYFQLGMVFEKLKDYEQARTYYQQALDIFIETNDRNGQAKAYFHLGQVAEALMDIEEWI